MPSLHLHRQKLADEIKCESKEKQKMNQIEKKFSAGPVVATVWKNEGKEGKEFPSVSIERRYQDDKGDWKSTSSFNKGHLAQVVLVANKALESLYLKEEA